MVPKPPLKLVLQHQLRTTNHELATTQELLARRDAFIISWQPQVFQLHQQLNFIWKQTLDAQQMLVKQYHHIRGLRSTIVQREEESQGLEVKMRNMQRLLNARDAQHKNLETEVSSLRNHRRLLQDQERGNEQLETEINGLRSCRQLLQDQERENKQLKTEVAGLSQSKSRESELEKRLEDQNESKQKLRARVDELEKKNSFLNHLWRSSLEEIRDLKTLSPNCDKILQHPQNLQTKYTQLHTFERGQKLEGLPAEIQQQLVNTQGCGFNLEARQGETQYVLVDLEEPQLMYCLPLYNRILFTKGGNCPTSYALPSGATMDNIVADERDRFWYEVEFGDMFSRCIVRSTKPFIDVKFDYTMRVDDREFPSTMMEHLECQNATDAELKALAPYAHYHRRHLGSKQLSKSSTNSASHSLR